MKSFLLMGLSVVLLATTTSFTGEIQEKQLSKDVKLEYQHLESKGDNDKYEVELKDPHLFFMGTSQTGERKIIGEIDHKGVWKLAVDTKANNANTESEGTTHLLIRGKEDEENPIDIIISGKITKSMVGNFAKIKDVISKVKNGNFSSQEVLTILQNIKEAHAEGKNVKIIAASDPENALLLDNGTINYLHTSGVTPEEFTFKFNILGDTTNQMFLTQDTRSSLFSGKLSLAEWSKLWAFSQFPSWKDVPEGKLDWDVHSKSDIETTEAKFLFTSAQGKSFQIELHEKVELVSDWIKRFLVKVKENPPEEDPEDTSAQTIYKWLLAPKTLPLYSLIPLQSFLDFTGSFEYSADPSFMVQKGTAALSLLEKKESGLKFIFKSENTDKGSLQIVLAGGRSLFNRIINFYNTLEDSLVPFMPQGTGIGVISPEMKEDLFKLLLSYANEPKSEDKDLVLDVKYDGWNITIGNKGLHQFIIDLYQLKSKHQDGKTQEKVVNS